MKTQSELLRHLPPHLREICAILANGLLRLRIRTADYIAPETASQGENSLHFTAHQSRHANSQLGSSP